MTKYLAIDYGLARTGLAISDPEGNLAFPLLTLHLEKCGSRKALLARLADIARENGVEAIVMGLPLHGDGSESVTSVQARHAAEKIRRRLPLPFYWMPEYLSSKEAFARLQPRGLGCKRRKAVLDQVAACVILESFLALPEEERTAA